MFRRLRSDDGQGLIMVLFATLMILALVVGATTITAAQSIPARQSVDRAAALAAAEGGVQDYLAELASQCRSLETSCNLLDTETTSGEQNIGDAGSSFSWRVVSSNSAEGTVRIASTGTYSRGTARSVSRTLVADLVAGAQLGDFLYYSTYETQSPSLVNAQNPKRTIALSTAAKDLAGVPDDAVTWLGAAAYVPQSGESYPNSEVCGSLWYGEPSRAEQGVTSADEDWGEQSAPLSDGTDRTRGGTCEVMFSSATEMIGSVYSKDALLLSHSTASGSGPMFRGNVWTEWNPENNGGLFYRTVPEPIGGGVAAGSQLPKLAPTTVTLPGWETPAETTCTYRGATQISIVTAESGGQELVITSPLTAVGEGECYTSKPGDGREAITDGTGGVFEAHVPLTRDTTILVEDADGEESVVAPASETDTRGPGNTIFGSKSAPVTDVLDAAVSVTVEAEEDADDELERLLKTSTEEINKSIGESFEDLSTEERNEAPLRETLNEAIYAALTAELDEPADDPEQHPQYVRVHDPELEPGDGAEAPGTLQDAVYAWTFASENTRETDGESFASPVDGSTDIASLTDEVSYTIDTEELRATVVRLDCADEACIDDAVAGLETDTVPDASLPLITATATRSLVTTQTTRVSAFPLPGDRTSYSRTAGDAYIEGEVAGAVSLVAENDIVVTGDLTQKSADLDTPGSFSATDAIALVARNNVVVYHPVGCTAAGDAALMDVTTTGFCPNDLTGLVDNIAATDPQHPSRQYTNLAETPPTRIDAAVYALGGSFYLANHDKGTDLGTLRLNGAVYQQHRGAMGVEWAITLDQRTRPHSGYALDYTYDSTLPTKRFPFIPSDGRTHVGAWTLVGTSEILNEEGSE